MAKTNRLYQRPKRSTYYADLRDLQKKDPRRFRQVFGSDGGRVSTGTSDEAEALSWLSQKLFELQSAGKVDMTKVGARVRLADLAEEHLKEKARFRRKSTVARDRQSLDIFLEWAGQQVTLGEIDATKLSKYVAHRQRQGLAPQTILHELHALSSLFRTAISKGYLTTNPVSRMAYKPRVERNGNVEVLEPEEAARFLAACEGDVHTLMAIALLTGGRRNEVCGLEWRDVNFSRELVHFRPNRWRKLKRGDERVVRLWPQLREALEALPGERDGLMVESPYGGMYKDVRASMETAAKKAEIDFRKVDEESGEPVGSRISWNTLRHTYASLRLQTIEHGAPISPFKVAKELGHSNLDMIFKHYGAILESPQRLEVVEYRLEDEEIPNT